jgi:hypothetical protein
MKLKLISALSKWEYTKIKAVTFADYSRLILIDHMNFCQAIESGKIYVLLSDKSILTFLNGPGVVIFKDNFLRISCPKLILAKEDSVKIKLQENLIEIYQKIDSYEKERFQEITWIEEDENSLRSI